MLSIHAGFHAMRQYQTCGNGKFRSRGDLDLRRTMLIVELIRDILYYNIFELHHSISKHPRTDSDEYSIVAFFCEMG